MGVINLKFKSNRKTLIFILLIAIFISSFVQFTNIEASEGDNQISKVISVNDNDARSGGDAGNDFSTATLIINGTTYKGDLKDDYDDFDYYKFQVDEVFETIFFVLRSPEGIYFDITLYNPAGNSLEYNYMNNEIKQVSYIVYSTGVYRVRIARRENNPGSYSFALNFNEPITPKSARGISPIIFAIIFGTTGGIALLTLAIFLIARNVRIRRSFRYEETYDDYYEDDFYSQRKGQKYSSEEPTYSDYETPKDGTKIVKMKGNTDGVMCMQCYIFMKANEEALQCPLCNAAFHKDHIEEYILVNHCCPICKGKLKC